MHLVVKLSLENPGCREKRQKCGSPSAPFRWQDKEELRRAMSTKPPAKIDIGPVYNVDPQRRKAYTGAINHHGKHYESIHMTELLWMGNNIPLHEA